MRVLFALGPAQGGMRRHVQASMEALTDQGVEVGAVGPDPPFVGDSFAARIPIGALRAEGAAAEALRAAALRWQADLVHAHGLRAGLVARAGRLPYAYTLHAFPPKGPRGPLFDFFEGRVIRQAGAVSAVSEPLRRRAQRLGAGAPVTLSPGPDLPPGPLPWPDAPGPLVGTMARLVPEKGLEVLIQAFRDVSAALPLARLRVAGEGPLGPKLEASIQRADLSGRIALVGWVEAPGFLQSLQIYVQPSLREGLGMAAQEALAAGRPVVASRVGGLPEAVGEGGWSRLVPPGDPGLLAEAILDLSHLNLEALGAAAHRHAWEVFRPGRFGRALLEFYGSMRKREPGRGP